MKPGGGKQKGSQFERDICKDLSLWISNDKRDDLFWRSAMSGGRATIGYKSGIKRKAQTGDISSITKLGNKLTRKFIIECKSYEDLEIPQTLLKGKGKLHEFWTKVWNEADNYQKVPILIAKQNYFPIIVCIVEGYISEAETLLFTVCEENMDVMLFSEFVKLRPEEIISV